MKQADMRSLSPEARRAMRQRVIDLRAAGNSYARIAGLTGLSRTGVFDICARHQTAGVGALDDAPSGRKTGDGRRLTAVQEALIGQLIASHTPDELRLPQPLWTRGGVGELIELRLGLALPVRTLADYLARWGFVAVPPPARRPGLASPAVQRWLRDDYPAIAALARAQEAEVGWAGQHALAGDRRRSMIHSVSNKGQLRWKVFAGALDAGTVIDFLHRLTQGATRRLLLVMDRGRVGDQPAVERWLLAHEEAIQVFHLPGLPAAPAPPRVRR